MNEAARNKCVSILALAAALLIPAPLPHSAHGMYDPKHGRWLQRDPLGVTVEDGAGVPNPNRQYRDGGNLYQYVKSRPVRHADPYGRCVCKVESFNVNVASTLTKENKTIEIDGEPLYIGQHVSREFTAEASFVKNGGSHCCEYRQFVKGTYKRNGRVVREMPILQEDCATVDGWPTPGGQMCYGHRWEGINTAYDTYFDRPPPYADDRKWGARYVAVDTPGLNGESGGRVQVNLEFVGVIVDTCPSWFFYDEIPPFPGRLVAIRSWFVDIDYTVPDEE